MGYYKDKGYTDERKPKKPIQWKEVVVNAENFDRCYKWCEENHGVEYVCWFISGNRWGSNLGLWKVHKKHKDKFCFRDEKIRFEVELKFG